MSHAWALLDRPMEIPLASRVKITGYGLPHQQLQIVLGDDSLRRKVYEANSSFLAVVPKDRGEHPAMYSVDAEDGYYIIRDASGAQFVHETPLAGADGVARITKILDTLLFTTIFCL